MLMFYRTLRACFVSGAVLTAGAVQGESQTYRYDPDGRLVGVDYGSGEKVDYPVDDIGNRTAATKIPAPPSTIAFSAATASVAEGTASIALSVLRLGTTTGSVSVRCFSDGSYGTALAGSDYTATSRVLTWADGDSTPKSCPVSIINDSALEPNETFKAALDSAAGGVLVSPGSVVVTIRDDDTPAAISFVSGAPTRAETSTGPFYVQRTGGSVGTVTVNYATQNGTATAPSDYRTASGTLTWGDNDMANKPIEVDIIDDSQAEMDETFSITLSAPTGKAALASPSTATVTIRCNDGYACP